MEHNRNWKLPALILAIAIVLHGGITNAYAASGKIAYSEPLIADKTVRGVLYGAAATPDGGVLLCGGDYYIEIAPPGTKIYPLAMKVTSEGTVEWRTVVDDEDMQSFVAVNIVQGDQIECADAIGNFVTFDPASGKYTVKKACDMTNCFPLANGQWFAVKNITSERPDKVATEFMLLDEEKNVLWNRVYPELAGLDTDGLVISEQADGSILVFGTRLENIYDIFSASRVFARIDQDGQLREHKEFEWGHVISQMFPNEAGVIAIGGPKFDPDKINSSEKIGEIIKVDRQYVPVHIISIQLQGNDRLMQLLPIENGYLVRTTQEVLLLDKDGMLVDRKEKPQVDNANISYGFLVSSGSRIFYAAQINDQDSEKTGAYRWEVYEVLLQM